jgi:hypothetical protein
MQVLSQALCQLFQSQSPRIGHSLATIKMGVQPMRQDMLVKIKFKSSLACSPTRQTLSL